MNADLVVAYIAAAAAAGIVGYYNGWQDGKEFERQKALAANALSAPKPIRIIQYVGNIREFRKRIKP